MQQMRTGPCLVELLEIDVRLFSVVFELSIGCITQRGVNAWMLLEQ